MENAWNEYLKLEKDVSQLKKALQEQMNSSLVSQVSPFPDPVNTLEDDSVWTSGYHFVREIFSAIIAVHSDAM